MEVDHGLRVAEYPDDADILESVISWKNNNANDEEEESEEQELVNVLSERDTLLVFGAICCALQNLKLYLSVKYIQQKITDFVTKLT